MAFPTARQRKERSTEMDPKQMVAKLATRLTIEELDLLNDIIDEMPASLGKHLTAHLMTCSSPEKPAANPNRDASEDDEWEDELR